jgi:hypothetical protein
MAPKNMDDVQRSTALRLTALAICGVAFSLARCPPALGQSCDLTCPPEGRELVPCGPAFAVGLDVRAEYLLWWTDAMGVPALVTTSPNGTARDQAGVLGQPNTAVLYGGTGLNGEAHSGGRFAVGGWFDACRTLGFELGYTFLEQDNAVYSANSQGDPILARPFVNADTGLQDSGLVAYPNVAEGSLVIDAATQFHTAEALLTKPLMDGCGRRVVMLLGYRYALLDDDLSMTETMVSRETSTLGARLDLFDQFTTTNSFNGPQLGLLTERQSGVWTIQLLTKVALGSVHSEVTIDGTTTTTTANAASATAAGGFYALPTNLGSYEQDKFSALTEVGLKLSCDIDCHWRASIGYSFLYWRYAARAGDQIDTTLGTGEFPPGQGSAGLHPQFPFRTSAFWAQGLSFGVERRF